MENKTKEAKNWLMDLGEHIAGSFNWSRLVFILLVFIVSTASYMFIKNK